MARREALSEAFSTTLRWLEEKQNGEFIEVSKRFETPAWRKSHLSFRQISQPDLDKICKIINKDFLAIGQIDNSMGEIVSTKEIILK